MNGLREGVTHGMKRLQRDLVDHQLDEEEQALARELQASRPRFRSDCADAPRPCPYISCKHHLYLEVTKFGSIRFPFPNLELDELADTCALDVADRGGIVLDAVGSILAVSRERVRQVETTALERYRAEFERLP